MFRMGLSLNATRFEILRLEIVYAVQWLLNQSNICRVAHEKQLDI